LGNRGRENALLWERGTPKRSPRCYPKKILKESDTFELPKKKRFYAEKVESMSGAGKMLGGSRDPRFQVALKYYTGR